MKKCILFIILAGAVCLMPLWAAEKESKEEKTFAAKVKELTEGKESREEKIIAVYAFVRDEIVEIKTKYG